MLTKIRIFFRFSNILCTFAKYITAPAAVLGLGCKYASALVQKGFRLPGDTVRAEPFPELENILT